VRWKLAVPGLGLGSPIVWGDLVLLSTAVDSASPAGARDFVVMAVGRSDGAERWRRVVHSEVPHEGTHQHNSYASASLLTDGRRVYAYFGSRGLYALDLTGQVLWQKQLGRMQTRNGFGEAASPALHADTLVVTWDHEGPDFVVALDAASGKERWRRERDEPTTWATPLVITGEGAPQVVVSGTNRVVSYDLATGAERWRAGGLTLNAIPSPVYADGVVYLTAGFRGNALQAIRVSEARGEVTAAPALVFRHDRDTPYVPSPLLYKGQLYFLKSNSGVLTCLDAKDGSVRFSERLEAVPNVYASRPAASTSPGATASWPCSPPGRSSSCSPPTGSTTASTPRPRWWTARSTCAGASTSTASRSTEVDTRALTAPSLETRSSEPWPRPQQPPRRSRRAPRRRARSSTPGSARSWPGTSTRRTARRSGSSGPRRPASTRARR
jgi:outer membrane protein assembly factor BamB